nr:MAG TPA: hypothetical protein [Caudoviricetes sp.]
MKLLIATSSNSEENLVIIYKCFKLYDTQTYNKHFNSTRI